MFAGAIAAAILWSGAAAASTVTFDFNYQFSTTGTSPVGGAPWFTAMFADNATPGSVELTVSTGGLSGSEYVSGLYFNLDPALNPAGLTFLRNSASTGPVSANIDILTAVNTYKADGDGRYDILFDLPSISGRRCRLRRQRDADLHRRTKTEGRHG
jgi:hypothetical protein